MARLERGRAEFPTIEDAVAAAKGVASEMLLENFRNSSEAQETRFEVVVTVHGVMYSIAVAIKITQRVRDEIVAEMVSCSWEAL